MSCNEGNKSLIIKVEAIPTRYVDMSKYNTLVNEAPLQRGVNYDIQSDAQVIDISMDYESASVSSKQERTRGGIKYLCELKYSTDISAEEATVLQQIRELESEEHSLLITYFGGEQSFICAPANCILFSHEQNEGRYDCTINIQNLTDIQTII